MRELMPVEDYAGFLGDAFQRARTGMVACNQDGRVMAVNPEICRMFQMSHDEIVGHSFLIFVPKEDRRAAKQSFDAVRQGGFLEQPDWHVRLRDGSSMWVRVVPAFVEAPDGDPWVLSVLTDVTRSREAEAAISERYRSVLEHRVKERTAELEQAFQELERFSYSVSHDLRAPLRTINGFTSIILVDHAEDISEVVRDNLQRVVTATHRMGELIDDLLGYARLARVELVRDRVNLTAVAREIASDLNVRHGSKPVETIIEDGLCVHADAQLLRVLLANLLENAWKYTGKVADPRVEVGSDPERGFFVRDNGVGFEAQYSEKLFKPFERLHSAAEYPGTGIGLANVHRVVQRHGGRVFAESAPGQGATFYFTLD